MKHSQKWRETIDPFSLTFSAFQLQEILGYPHAGNDVFYVAGIYDGDLCHAFLKVERQTGADVENEIHILKTLPFDLKPSILEYSLAAPRYILTREAQGERLSVMLGDNEQHQSLQYLEHYGFTLARLHRIDYDCQPVKHRRFFDIPDTDFLEKNGLQAVEAFLCKNKPISASNCFVHGDFHYANILWEGKHIAAILDYELSGYGIREFDMAWAVFLRPGQKFLDTPEEVNCFLRGYTKLLNYSPDAFWYYYVMIAVRFYPMGDNTYQEKIMQLAEVAMKRYDEGLL